jgi:hypothetical protein
MLTIIGQPLPLAVLVRSLGGKQQPTELHMKSNRIAVTVMAATLLVSVAHLQAQSSYEAQQKAAAAAREKDPAWKPKTTQVDLIQIGSAKSAGALKNFCLNAEGNILAAINSEVRIYSPKGEMLKKLSLKFKPSAISVAKDGTIFVAGEGQIQKLDADGKVLATAKSPIADEAVTITKETEEMVKQMAEQTKRSYKEELANMKSSLERRRADFSALAVTGEDLFVTVGAPSDFSYRVYRMDLALENPKQVVEKLRGCCGQMNVQANDGKIWIPHNGRHQVEARDRDGKELVKFGKAGKVKPSDFGGCCEPKCMRVLPNGDILAAESGPPTCIKRFSPEGKFIEVVATADTKGDCVRVTVEVSPDGKRYYMLDTTRDAIRVFEPKS